MKMLGFFFNSWKKIKEYNRIASIEEIGRRYFVMNSFDGVLTIIGILVGSYLAGIVNAFTIIFTGISASVAMAISGIWGTYLTEEAERKKKVAELSRHTLRDLGNTKIGKAERMATIIIALIDGFAPFLSALIVLIPFFFASFLGITRAYFLAVSVAFAILLLLGAFLGHISKQNRVVSGIKMLVAGVICVVILLLIDAGHKTL